MPSDSPAVPGIDLQRGGKLDLPRLRDEDNDVLRGGLPPGEPDPGGERGEGGAERGGGEGEDASCLAESVALRLPTFTPEMTSRHRANLLQDHILATAIMRGRLAEMRLHAQVNLRAATAEWAKLGAGSSFKGNAALEAHRRMRRPDIGDRIDGAKWLIARCTEEMDRFGGNDYEASSRAYTILSGG